MAGARIILNSRYIHIAQPGEKAGKFAMTKDAAVGLVEYIGTREGVSLNLNEDTLNKNMTRKQQDIIEELLEHIPESKDTFEYRDLKENPTIGNASEFITRASELGEFCFVDIGEAQNLIEYVAKRPGAVRVGEHGLFSSSAEVDLKQAQEEIGNCKGRIWTHVVSIRREDADKLGYNSQQPWRDAVLSQIDNIAKQSNIPLQNLHWYAGMHNTGHHPHIHLIVFSDNPKKGKLTAEGIKAMKAGFSQSIFHDERLHIYEQKTQLRDDIKDQIETILDRIDINPEKQFSPKVAAEISTKLLELGISVKELPGRHVYKFLPKELKPVVDELMASLVKAPEIQKLYELYCTGHDELEKMYKLNPNDVTPIIDNKEFYSIKNQIVTQAEKLAKTMEQKSGSTSAFHNKLDNSVSETMSQSPPSSNEDFYFLLENDPPDEDFQEMSSEYADIEESSPLSSDENLSSLFDNVPPESENQSDPIDDFEPPAQIEPKNSKDNHIVSDGKFDSKNRKAIPFEEAYTKAVNGDAESRYQLARKYFYGTDIEQDYIQAQMWYGLASASGHSRAKYELGKMYLYGIGIEKDLNLSREYCLDAYWNFRSTVTTEIGFDLGSDMYDNIPIAELNLPKVSKDKAYLEYCLGRMEYAGEGVEKNNKKACKWFEAAAYHNHVHSNYYLGKLSYTGEGVVQSYATAAVHYDDAATGKDKYAYYALGRMHFGGIGIQQDYSQAAKWFSMASKENVSYADYQLAKMCEQGLGMDQDTMVAGVLYKKALDEFLKQEKQQPDAITEYRLAQMYLKGQGVEANLTIAAEWLTKCAEKDNAQAQFNLAKMYQNGEGVPIDEQAANDLYQKALNGFLQSEQINPNASQEYKIATIYEKGLGTDVNLQETVRWLTLAADNSHAHAAYRLGKFYEIGNGVVQDSSSALSLFLKSAEGEDKYAFYSLGKFYFEGTGVEQDYSEAANWFKKASEENIPYADYKLAGMFATGLGVELNAEQSSVLYEKALNEFIEQEKQQPEGFTECRIGQMYMRGQGTQIDIPDAIKWLTSATEKENAHAAYCLGKLYLHGEGVEQDNVIAFHWLLKAAEQEERNAYYTVGQMYYDGTGIAQDYTKAAIWLEKASNEDLPYADYKLAGMYFEGTGVTQDGAKSTALYQKSLSEYLEQEKHLPDSAVEYRLAQMYENGMVSKIDIAEALKWYTTAAENGHGYAQYKLSKLHLSDQGGQPDVQKANLYHKMALDTFIREDKVAPDAIRESIIAKMLLQGDSYALGFGSVPNCSEAIPWFEKSIQNGNSDAALDLAKLYESGQGVKKDLSKVQQLYGIALQGFVKQYSQIKPDNLSIEKQSILAYRIARMYLEGKGAPGNSVQALGWMMKAADLNNSVAQYQVGKMLLAGTGGIKDKYRAFDYFMKSAQSSNEYAQYQIGKMYEKGTGVISDEQEAKRWYHTSAANGNEAAQNKLEQLESGEKFKSAGALGILMRLLSQNMGDHITDSTTHKFRQDKKLLQKQRQMKAAHGHKDEMEESM